MADPVDRSRRAFLTGRIGGEPRTPRLGPSPPWLAGLISPACIEVCPEFAIGKPKGRALPPVELDPGKCLAAQGVVCIICVARCPERAITGRPGGHVSVTAAKCTGCGACVPSCPVGALDVSDGAD
jgi:ferredoxin-type protein NapF